MKRWLMIGLAVGLLGLSAFQFRLVAAAPPADATLQVIGADHQANLDQLRSQLDVTDAATRRLGELLDTETGQIAFAGLIDRLRQRDRQSARSEAIPRFISRHFEDTNGTLTLKPSSVAVAETWQRQVVTFKETLRSMRSAMRELSERLDASTEAGKMARRMLRDDETAVAIILEEFNGRGDPIAVILDKAFQKLLVQRDDAFIVVPTLGPKERDQLRRFELAAKIFPRLKKELADFSDEFAKNDDEHRLIAAAMKTEAMAAIVSLTLSDSDVPGVDAAIDKLFEQLEEATQDTPRGLVIDSEEAMDEIIKLVELSQRSAEQADAVQDHLIRMVDRWDLSDPPTRQFADAIESKVVSHFIAAELPEAEMDLAGQITSLIVGVTEPGTDGLRIRDDRSAEVIAQAGEFLAMGRTIRRYLGRLERAVKRIDDDGLAQMLSGDGTAFLLSEVRRDASQGNSDWMALLRREVFLVDAKTDQLTLRPEHASLVDRLSEQASRLTKELDRDDF